MKNVSFSHSKVTCRVVLSLLIGASGIREISAHESGHAGNAATAKPFDPSKHNVIDLTKRINRKKLKQGSNLIYTSPSGVKVSAIIRGNKAVRWTAINKDGKAIPVTYRKKDNEPTHVHCWICYDDDDVPGGIDCIKVLCKDFDFPAKFGTKTL